jgi:outer membrane protein TolC
VLGLLRLSQDYAAASLSEDAMAAQVQAAERSVTEQVQTSYLRLFEARASRQVAQTSQRQLEEQVTVAKARVAAGALTSADVLRVEVAKANVQQQELQAKVQESAAKTLLLTLLDLPVDAAVEFVEPTSLEEAGAAAAPAAAEASQRALAQRAELVQATKQADSAEALARSRLFSLLPEIDGEAAYVSVQGQALAEKESYFIGVKATWPVWAWGAQWFAHRAAEHQAQSARLLVEDSQRQVKVEVAGRVDQLEAATAAIEVAKKALESAEEAFRVTNELVKAGAGTTTDLLDSQSALTQAKLNLVRARYQQAQARVQLERAMGG